MLKVLMVCLGNICRSPLAEGLLKSKIDSNQIFVDSAGTGAYHVGNLPDPRSIEVAKNHLLDITDQRARAFSSADFDQFDYIYVMDASNYSDVLKLAVNEVQKSKVKMILEELQHDSGMEVPDPYYGGDGGFEHVYQLLDESCTVIAEKLTN
jgi:protein-tyrosine phosphatase